MRISRRVFLAQAAAASFVYGAARAVPIGLELYSVRGEMKKDPIATVRQVAKMGYECIEFFSPYLQWTPAYAKEMRDVMDGAGVKCLSTHNTRAALDEPGAAMELNRILGSRTMVMASAGKVEGADGWKSVAHTLNSAQEKLSSAGLQPSYHNHQAEFMGSAGARPIDILMTEAPLVKFQLDVGTVIEAGVEPVLWLLEHKGRFISLHCKDWSSKEGYKVLLGEGAANWGDIVTTARKFNELDSLLVEQEGSRFGEFETAEKCLAYAKRTF